MIDPVAYCKEYSRDMLLLYLFTAFPVGEDGNFDQKEAILQFNAKLSNNFGNLLNRFITLTLKLDGKILGKEDAFIKSKREEYQNQYNWYMQVYDLKNALDDSFAFSTELNQFIDAHKPWKLDPVLEEDRLLLQNVLYTVGVGLAFLAYNLSPFFEGKMKELLDRIGVGK